MNKREDKSRNPENGKNIRGNPGGGAPSTNRPDQDSEMNSDCMNMIATSKQHTFFGADAEFNPREENTILSPDAIDINFANLGVNFDDDDDDDDDDCRNDSISLGSNVSNISQESSLARVPKNSPTNMNPSAARSFYVPFGCVRQENRLNFSLKISPPSLDVAKSSTLFVLKHLPSHALSLSPYLGLFDRKPPAAPAPLTDRYGFFIDEPEKEVLGFLARRESLALTLRKEQQRSGKWLEMTNKWDMYMKRKRSTVKRRIRKGIPAAWRGKVWNLLGKVEELIKKHPTAYQELCDRNRTIEQDDPEYKTHHVIECDINRTFPKHKMFSSETPEGQEGTDKLRRVLRAYALYDPQVQYCQGMGFFTAMFLMYMEEERAFWQLVSVMRSIRGLFMPLMADARQALSTIKDLVRKFLPKISDHFEKTEIHYSMFATHWYLTLFTSSFPFDMVTRVWDCFLNEGFKVIHRVALALLKCFQAELLSQDFEDVLHTLHHTIAANVDTDVVMQTAFSLPLKQKRVKKYEKRWTTREKAVLEEARNSSAAQSSSSSSSLRR